MSGTTITIDGNSNASNLVLGSANGSIVSTDSATPIVEVADSVNNISELPVFANKAYVGKFQPGRLPEPIYVVYKFNEDGTKYNLNFDPSYSNLFSKYVVENVIITKQNTPPGFVGSYYKGFDTSGVVFNGNQQFTGYQQTGINFIGNKLYWFPETGPELRTSLLDFSNNLSMMYEASMAALITQQLELYPTKYYTDPLAWLTDPYMIDSTNITETDLSNQTNQYNKTYNNL